METDELTAYLRAAQQWSPERHLLVMILDQLRLLNYKMPLLTDTSDSPPEPFPRPGMENPDGMEAVTVEEFDDWYQQQFLGGQV